MMCSYASLDGGQLEALQSLEKKLGKVLLAFSCRDVNAEKLSDEELAELKKVEEKLGLALVAVK
jgi:hypothetical protein